MTPRFVRPLLGSIALGVPFVLLAHAASALVAPLTSSTVAVLQRATAPLATPHVAAAPDPEASLDAEPDAPTPAAAEIATKPSGRAVRAPAKAKPSALFVSEKTVLQLAQGAARPRGSFVAQTPQHPAGLRLSGVAALGIGLQDGDILIEALGLTPRAAGEIIGAIIQARAKQARYLSGTIWRQGQTFRITVEQPYLDGSASQTPAPPAAADLAALASSRP